MSTFKKKLNHTLWLVYGRTVGTLICGRLEERPVGGWVRQQPSKHIYLSDYFLSVYDLLNSKCTNRTETWSLLHK